MREGMTAMTSGSSHEFSRFIRTNVFFVQALGCWQSRVVRINWTASKPRSERWERSDMVDVSELYQRGLKRRQTMFGEADVAKRMATSGEFGAPLQKIINAYV